VIRGRPMKRRHDQALYDDDDPAGLTPARIVAVLAGLTTSPLPLTNLAGQEEDRHDESNSAAGRRAVRTETCLACSVPGISEPLLFVIESLTSRHHHHHLMSCEQCAQSWYEDVVRGAFGQPSRAAGTPCCAAAPRTRPTASPRPSCSCPGPRTSAGAASGSWPCGPGRAGAGTEPVTTSLAPPWD